MGLIAPWHVGSSWTRDQSHVSCISRSLNRWKSQTGIFWITLLWIIVYLSFGEFSSLWYKTMKGYTGPWGRYKFRLNAAKSLQSCPTLCDPIDGSPPGSLIPGILQATTLEWVAISLSNAWKWKGKVKLLSRVRLLATQWTAATRLLCPWGFPGKSTGVGCHCLLC